MEKERRGGNLRSGRDGAGKNAASDRKSSGERARELVDRMKQLADQEDWRRFLEEKGDTHKKYYHYTTLSVLRKIIGGDDKESIWQVPCNRQSNDMTEKCGWSVSFVTSVISNIGMWSVYCPKPENGVMIEFPHKIWREIFIDNPVLGGACARRPHATDVAYYHIGRKPGGNGDLLYWRNIQLPEAAMRWKFSQDIGQAVPYLKKDIWRFEQETRVFYEADPRSRKREIELPIGKKLLKHLRFHLSPLFTSDDGKLFREEDHAEIAEMILPGQTIVTGGQFVFPSETYGISLKKKREENILKTIREKFPASSSSGNGDTK